ncbi:MAG: hypothetical protein M3Q45_07645, partial [Chloroflexota bacterium]|nr:hypothetical protein [Chloroflexota bacterium]
MRLESHMRRPAGNQATPTPAQSFFMLSARQIFVIITAVSILLRVASALLQGETVAALPGVFDQISYHGLAQRLIDGYG